MLKIRRPVVKMIHTIDEPELGQLKKRTDIATAVIIFFWAVLLARLWFLQIHHGAEYKSRSESNRVRIQEIIAPRGDILARGGEVMVTNRPCFNVVWIKEDAPDPALVIKRLARILNEDITTLLGRVRAAAEKPRYIPIRLAEDIDWNTLAYIENNHFELPGVRIEVLPRRQYLQEELAAHLLGYLGEINQQELESKQWDNYRVGDQLGKTGIEKIYEAVLRGEKGRFYVEVDAHGVEQQISNELEPLPGSDIRLTIDLDLQLTAEQAMADKAGAVVALEVNSGRLLTIVSSPALKLRDFVGGISWEAWQALQDDPLHPLLNKVIQGAYPPGSTYKIVTALAGLSEGIITPETVFYCSGSLSFGNRRYGCWKRHGHGAVNLHRALAESCDVYFYMAGQKIGVDLLAKYAGSLGLGRKSGIDLENERSGLIPTAEWKKKRHRVAWQEGETLSVAIGQGFNMVTPLQVTLMMAATANGGLVYRPQFIESITDQDGKIIKKFEPIVDGKVLGHERSLKLIRDALVTAVNERHGTAEAARLKDLVVGGKTGTAQVVRLNKFKNVPEEEIPYKYKDHAWFTAFAPAAAPEIAVTVLIEHGGHGGSAAAPVVKKVIETYFEKKRAAQAVAVQ